MSDDIRIADAQYAPFPAAASWTGCLVDGAKLEGVRVHLAELRETSVEQHQKAIRTVSRAAAVETGAVEGLYEADRGLTMTVATQAALWETAVQERSPRTRSLIEDQLAAYEYVLDFATKSVRIGEAWIRELHRSLCGSQETYEVQTDLGPQEHELEHGAYKRYPNHVRRKDGSLHSYSPVAEVTSEMERLVRELDGPDFASLHPVVQAAFAHYSLVVIHPFADGNGRMARALGSVFTYRELSLPLLVLSGDRESYFRALEAADAGDLQAFVDFVVDRCVDAVSLIRESMESADVRPVKDISAALKGLYQTSGGFRHDEVDAAAKVVLRLFMKTWTDVYEELEGASIETHLTKQAYPLSLSTSRLPVQPPPQQLVVKFETSAPAQAVVAGQYGVEVPQDAGSGDSIVINDTRKGVVFSASLAELRPKPSAALQLRLSMVVQRLGTALLEDLKVLAERALRSRGY